MIDQIHQLALVIALVVSGLANVYLVYRIHESQKILIVHNEMIEFLMRASKHLFELHGYKTKFVPLESVPPEEDHKDGN